jgi:penicillin-binding protein 1A
MGKKQSERKYIFRTWFFVLFPVVVIFSALAGLIAFADLPSLKELENPKANLASEVISSDMQVLGKFYIENRTDVSFSDLPPHLVNALVATEDARFYRHSGVDIKALFRSIAGVIKGRSESSGGGSTLSQQLAKMLFPRQKLNRFSLVFRKFKEWIIAVKLEKNYTKDEIISMYLNKFDFINNAVGIKSASAVYFSTTPSELRIEEAAVLVGMAKNPSLYNPVKHPIRALERRNTVIAQMKKYNFISEREADSLKKIPIKLHFSPQGHNEGTAAYFREFIREFMRNWCKNHKRPDGKPYDLYKDGLKIYTTVDARMQKYAEEATAEWLGKELQPKFFEHWKGRKNAPFYRLSDKETNDLLVVSMRRSERYRVMKEDGKSDVEILAAFKKPVETTLFSWKGEIDTLISPWDSMRYSKYFLQTGFMAMDPSTGYVKAWVGGINYKHFKYDHVMTGKRQVGSTFKPFVYTLAMQEEWSPCYKVPNIPVTFELPEGGTWTPRNSDGKYGGMMTLKRGLALSVNTITAYVMKQFGPPAVVNLARKMGIQSPLEAVPSLCLGTADLSVYEMVGANATFANQGVWSEPGFITRIEDKNGIVLDEFIPKRIEAISPQTAYLALNLMKGVVDYGTGARLRYRYDIRVPLAGKTGTTQNNSDGWFMGITSDVVAGCWVGCEDRSAHFRSTDLGQGASMALPIFGIFFKKCQNDTSLAFKGEDFVKPAGINPKLELDCSKYNEDKDSEETIQYQEEEIN